MGIKRMIQSQNGASSWVRYFVLSLIALCTLCLAACKPDYSAFTQEVEQLREEYHNDGLALVVVKDNQVCYNQAWGELTPTTPVRCASISKTFVGVAVMQQVEAGRLNLQDDASDWLGYSLRNPLYPDVPVTLENLLSHTSSLNDDDDHPFNDYAPGQGYCYCDVNITLVARILEQVTGQPFDEYITEHVLQPLGIAAEYRLPYPASGLWISAEDLTKWMLFLMNDPIAEEMMRPRFPSYHNYGLTLLHSSDYSPNIDLVGHKGGCSGLRHAFYFHPQDKYGFIVLSTGTCYAPEHPEICLPDGEGDTSIRVPLLRLMYRTFIQ